MQAKPRSARLDVKLFIAALLFSVNLSAQQQVSQSSSQPAQQTPQRGQDRSFCRPSPTE